MSHPGPRVSTTHLEPFERASALSYHRLVALHVGLPVKDKCKVEDKGVSVVLGRVLQEDRMGNDLVVPGRGSGAAFARSMRRFAGPTGGSARLFPGTTSRAILTAGALRIVGSTASGTGDQPPTKGRLGDEVVTEGIKVKEGLLIKQRRPRWPSPLFPFLLPLLAFARAGSSALGPLIAHLFRRDTPLWDLIDDLGSLGRVEYGEEKCQDTRQELFV
jgi:hypothetical protein